MRTNFSNTRGFTLIELCFALAVVGVLFGIALPGFSSAMEAARAAQVQSDLLQSLTTSISRAAVLGEHVVLCSSSDGTRCAGSADWSNGWIGFVDLNRDRQRTPNEPQVSAAGALPGAVHLRSTVGRTRLVFQPNGGNAGSNVTFTLCDGRGPSKAKALVLNNRGDLHAAPTKPKHVAAACAG